MNLSRHETYYNILGISSNSSQAEIKSAYLKLAKETHPDATGSSENAEFIRIKEAFEVLSDPGKKKSYDWFVEHKQHSYEKENAARSRFEQNASLFRQSVTANTSASTSASAYAAGNTVKSSEYVEAEKFRQQLRNKFPRNEQERRQKVHARKVPLRSRVSLGVLLLPVLLTGAWAYGGYRMA
uniref:J domain-containing protein n=1 Tax=Aplanochytrium stocchinoi TaxID=215587 RepID=A0A7S3LME7_9STRA|mmetsp:Transcript_9866/g.12305  ORF Transcript_9866/g.12305 Transcript_9866/m.12305 type:complete len:183 (+) Transcript_9866:306-854(+)|eukprot:CAMPEP_0204823226 /NCGR_PEP_ID=MMETSP1346-20131115/1309_1 /ASSEMBLY_ACC=CAM_ASM_000771 /TAXON_ID=215587 /ORGANISM="Aplanochytrium stocchinoi, Strain GSBS06" /LENGTH=182 /DNA_ID=CAMNT_0051949783 /DNA_START=395 /DNA_END=943 /DNA_ORIENTATION=-